MYLLDYSINIYIVRDACRKGNRLSPDSWYIVVSMWDWQWTIKNFKELPQI